MSKDRRRSLLLDILRSEPPTGQQELVEHLRQRGESATQATVSRDLAALGAFRGPQGYIVPLGRLSSASESDESAELNSLVRRHAVFAEPAHSLVVVRTAPGHAQMLASAFDRWKPKGVVGTVGGDDTIFLATLSPNAASVLALELQRLIGVGE